MAFSLNTACYGRNRRPVVKTEKIVALLFDFRAILCTRFNEEGKMFASRVVLRE